ncbi:MAG TPA: Asp-tRNA(Asn)/Glu-tRNA(Gln) amidotransferase subunit GatB [Candidatus Nanoarchaeia archaeon]|nr:Asp-tRNA(Asn)/Glu-tRNA(Gln) amidotransferase subunit GatB [Candidatus Nanoarchaeia archaeon]
MNDVLVGIECHVELNTKSKLFCGCSSKGEIPNSSCCPVCLGMPGSKPVLNEKALEYALKLCLAFGCKIDKELIFSRKIYFYPDMSKNYQITQYENPLGIAGEVEILGKKIRIRRIHMEEDPAALIHEKNNVLVDYNRSGHALCEIVTEPDMHSAEEARLFMRYLLTVLKYLQIYDVKEGIVKADLNVNIAGCSRVEIKNVSGFKDIQRAIEYEITRQKKLLNDGEPIVKQETRGWDGSKTNFQRYKEQEDDYGYIFDTDLVPVETAKYLKGLKLPELPKEKKLKYVKQGLKLDDAEVIADDYELAELYESIKVMDRLFLSKWIRREVPRVLNYTKKSLDETFIANHLGKIINLILNKKITERVGQKLMELLSEKDLDIENYIKEHDLSSLANENELIIVCKDAIKNNKQIIQQYKSGNEKSMNFLVGIVMKETRGRADPKRIREIIFSLI